MEEVLVSVVIPVRNEAANIGQLAEEIDTALSGRGWVWECIWVDDGSNDGTLEELRSLGRGHSSHRYLSLDQQHGQTAALVAGFSRARGRLIATLDGDGQNDPADLPSMIGRLLADEADIILGIRGERRDDWIRRVSSSIGNGVRNWLNDEHVTDVGCSIRTFRRECIAQFPPFEGMHRFFPTVVGLQPFRRIEVTVNHRPRRHGQAKYGIRNRLWKGLIDACAVRWMQRRQIRYTIGEESDTEDA